MEKVPKKVGMEHFKTKINVNNMKPHIHRVELLL